MTATRTAATLLVLFSCGSTAKLAPIHAWRSQPSDVTLSCGHCLWKGVEATADIIGASGREMYLLPCLLTAEETLALHEAAANCDTYDIAQPDTVDKEPTFQANIFEAGEAVLGAVAELLEPIISERILPYVRAKFACPDACMGDALLRRYRAGERTSLNLHYDIQAFATAIIPLSIQQERPLSSTAPVDGGQTTYTGGLFVQGGASRASRRLVRFEHAGDVLVHQFDLMHGVDVHGGTRYAIALWFYDSPQSRVLGTAPWVRRAAESGNADAQFLQATFCAQGRFGNRRDDDDAARWLERGAAQGHATSQLGLARHLLGTGDAERAAACFRAAAEQGHVEAQYSLALCLLDGMGVPRSATEAAKWFQKAAAEGGEFGNAAALELTELRQGCDLD